MMDMTEASIPIIIHAIVQVNKKKRYWHCRGCGTVYQGYQRSVAAN